MARPHDGPIHLLVTDVVMPGMGGRELAERLRPPAPGDEGAVRVAGTPTTRWSGTASWQAEVAFLQKPFTPVALAPKVREVLALQPPHAGTVDASPSSLYGMTPTC